MRKYIIQLMVEVVLLAGWLSTLQAGKKPHNSLPATVARIRYKNECVGLFAAMDRSRNPKSSSQTGLSDRGNQNIDVEVVLTPGCEAGFETIETPIWPEFSKLLRFEFSFSDVTKSDSRSQQPLKATLLEVENPAWTENETFRKLEFLVKDVPVDSDGSLVITIFTSNIEVGQVKLVLEVKSSKTKMNHRS